MKKLKLNYTCTDPDCAQYMAKVTDTRYSYIEYREWLFEQLGFDDMEFNAEQKSEGAAIKFIHEWMEG